MDPVNAPADTKAPGLDALSDADLDKFMLTGDLPSEVPAEKTEEAAASKPVDQAASTDASSKAATEAAEPAKVKAPGQKKSAAERAEQIERETSAEEDRLRKALAKRREVREALEEAEREDRPSKAAKSADAATAATAEPSWKKYRTMPGAPKAEDFPEGGLDDYVAAMGSFIAEKIAEEKFNTLYEARSGQDREASERDRAFVESAEAAEIKVRAEVEADPEILGRIDPRWKALNPSDRLAPGEQLSPAHFVKDQVTFNSNHPAKLSEWLTANDGEELRRIGRMRPDQIIREIAIKDASFDGQTPDDAGEAAGERQHSRVSKAPAPSPTLGKKATPARNPHKAPESFDDFDSWNLGLAKEEAGRRA